MSTIVSMIENVVSQTTKHCQTQPVQQFKFYAIADRTDVQNARWYRTYTRCGRRRGFVDRFDDAKVWTKRGPAQGKCTVLGGTSILVEFVVQATDVVLIDQTEHRRKFEECQRKENERLYTLRVKRELALAEEEFKAAQAKVERLKKQ